jgi:hypothetical protein
VAGSWCGWHRSYSRYCLAADVQEEPLSDCWIPERRWKALRLQCADRPHGEPRQFSAVCHNGEMSPSRRAFSRR